MTAWKGGGDVTFTLNMTASTAKAFLEPFAQRVVGAATPALQKAAAAQGGKAPLPSEEAVLTALVAALDQLTA